jgi:hypothetical protein
MKALDRGKIAGKKNCGYFEDITEQRSAGGTGTFRQECNISVTSIGTRAGKHRVRVNHDE